MTGELKLYTKQSGGAYISITIWLWKVSLWSLYYHHILVTGTLGSINSNKIWFKDNIITPLIVSLDGYSSKIRKVSRCRPVVSNENILTTRQEFFLVKVASVQSITDIVLLYFWLILLGWIFTSSHSTICFSYRNLFFQMFKFHWIRYSNVLICVLVEKGSIN